MKLPPFCRGIYPKKKIWGLCMRCIFVFLENKSLADPSEYISQLIFFWEVIFAPFKRAHEITPLGHEDMVLEERLG
jgi:hypothetical protein